MKSITQKYFALLRQKSSKQNFASTMCMGMGFMLLWACQSSLQGDLHAPRLVHVSPPGFVIGGEQTLHLHFSESLDPKTINAQNVILLKQEHLRTPEFIKDFANGKLSDAHEKLLRQIDVNLVENSTLVVKPKKPLLGGVTYGVMVSSHVRDLRGNPMINNEGIKTDLTYLFQTRPNRPKLLQHDVHGVGGPDISPDRTSFHFVFSDPIAPASLQTGILLLADMQDESDRLQLIQQNADRTELTVFLSGPPQGCERLRPNTTYRFVFTPQLTGDGGMALQEESVAFTTASHCDTTPHVVLSPVQTVAMQNSAVIRFATNKPSSSQVWFGLEQQDFGCLGQSCPVVGKQATLQIVKNEEQPQFDHKINIKGLQLGKTYQFVVTAQDANGRMAMDSGTFTTETLPAVAINEIMINPHVQAGGVEWEAEFVELLNYGNEPINLEGYFIALLDEENEPIRSCPIPALPGNQLLQPNTPLVLAGNRFDPTQYPNLPNWKVHRMKTSQLCGSLSNAGTQTIALQDPKGRIVSSYSGHIPNPEEGISIERIAPDAADSPSGFCHSPSIKGSTPGQTNEANEHDCMPLE